jgi:DNA-binding CsgD family transcriptional regulator
MGTTGNKTATALLAALRHARDIGGARQALAADGIELPDGERFAGLSADLQDLLGKGAAEGPATEALALGYIAGRVAHGPRKRRLQDPTAFVMDPELVVQSADGESILRLPWFDDELFVGRQLPDIPEMPGPIRTMCVDNYTSALAGERRRFDFISYGHAYAVDAVPVHGEDGRVSAVLAVATPGRSRLGVATTFERTAERLERCAALADQRAEGHHRAARSDASLAARGEAGKARQAARRLRANAQRIRSQDADISRPPSISPREAEVLGLASHGLNRDEIAEVLAVSPATVRTHLEHVYVKLGASDKAAAVATALRHGLIE